MYVIVKKKNQNGDVVGISFLLLGSKVYPFCTLGKKMPCQGIYGTVQYSRKEIHLKRQ